MKYNPRLSIEENAIRNKCSVAAVRKFIRLNGIDRRYESKVNKIDEIRRLLTNDPHLSLADIAKKLKMSLNTIRRYYPYATGDKQLSKSDTPKVSKIDVREINNYYATHPSVTEDLLRVEIFNHLILEPCCGGGFMAESIKKAGYEVEASDIIDRGYGKQADFLKDDFPANTYDIITNPPYTDIVAFISRALELCKQKVAFLMPLRYLSSMERYYFFQQYPPIRVYCYANRITIAKSGRFDLYDAGANIEIYAWYIWEKGYQGKTELKWIVNKP